MTELFVKEKSIGMGNLTIDNQDFGNVEYEISLKRPATKNEQIAYHMSKILEIYTNGEPHQCEKCPYEKECPITVRSATITQMIIKDKTFIEE